MLKISKLADYATIIMVFLTRYTEQIFNAKEISEQTNLSLPTTSKLLKLLVASELLVSQRGSHGGYALAQSAKEVSIMQIIHAIEGESGLTECSHHNDRCALQAVCLVKDNWQMINQAIEQGLHAISLADFSAEKLPSQAFSFAKILEKEL